MIRNDDRIVEIIANQKQNARAWMIELINAGATASVLYSFVGVLQALESAEISQGESFNFDEEDSHD